MPRYAKSFVYKCPFNFEVVPYDIKAVVLSLRNHLRIWFMGRKVEMVAKSIKRSFCKSVTEFTITTLLPKVNMEK